MLVARYIPKQEPPDLEIKVADNISTWEDGIVLRSPGELTDSVRVVGEGRSTADDLTVNGSVNFSIEGKSPKGEEGSLKVCQILRVRLNGNQINWGEPVKPAGREAGVDWELPHRDGKQIIEIQVVRAEVEQGFWQELSRAGRVAGQSTTDGIADVLQAAIEHKRARAHKSVVLALDATGSPRHSFRLVVESFRTRHLAWAAAVGYKEIWVVGPIPDLTARLDVNAEE